MTSNNKKQAQEHIKELFRQADKEFREHADRSNRYVMLARKIAMKFQIKLPKEYKRKFCKHCYRYLRPGVNCRVRINKSRVIYYCKDCKKYMRFNLH